MGTQDAPHVPHISPQVSNRLEQALCFALPAVSDRVLQIGEIEIQRVQALEDGVRRTSERRVPLRCGALSLIRMAVTLSHAQGALFLSLHTLLLSYDVSPRLLPLLLMIIFIVLSHQLTSSMPCATARRPPSGAIS